MNDGDVCSIVPAASDDLATLLDLISRQLDEHGIRRPDRLRVAIGEALSRPELGFFLLARVGGRVAGVAYVSFSWGLEHGGRSAWLEELYVVPEGRNRGVGSRLLDAALRRARDAGCAALDLEVEHSHRRAENLYRRAGFERHSRSRWVRRLSGDSADGP
jgi:ribosomal protein S18 acetylase RimI-like enzyme